MKQLQERELQSIAAQDAVLAERYTALASQRDAILALVDSSKPSQRESDITGLRSGMRATSMLRQQVRDIEVTLTTLAESRERLATDRDLAENEWRRWWRKETKYTRLARTLRNEARKRQAFVESGELEERQSWGL